MENVLPKKFGDGWMSKSAADLCKIAVTFGGYELWPLVKALRTAPGRNVNVATVCRVLDQMRAEVK